LIEKDRKTHPHYLSDFKKKYGCFRERKTKPVPKKRHERSFAVAEELTDSEEETKEKENSDKEDIEENDNEADEERVEKNSDDEDFSDSSCLSRER